MVVDRRQKAVACFELVLVVGSLFAFSYLLGQANVLYGPVVSSSSPSLFERSLSSLFDELRSPLFSIVSAQSTLSQPSVCCERTVDGALCVNTDASNCAADARSTPTSCETTSYCQLGTCFDSDEGLCLENTPQSVCNQNGGNWDPRDAAQIPQCQLGCCIIGDQAAFVPPVRCKQLSNYYGVENNFRTDITSEAACIAVAQQQDMGACVYERDFERVCEFTTRAECGATEGVQVSNGTQIELSSGRTFYHNLLCSAEELNTACARQVGTVCKGGDVYWTDSCGNVENVWSSNRDVSWNNGRVLEADGVCAPTDGSDSSCGNCDYLQGTRCSEFETLNIRPADADHYCKATGCVDRSGNTRINGESWCVYDGAAGNGLDPVGSRHFREVCVDGEVEVEACADFRNEVCLQGSIETDTGDFSVSACRANRWQDCTKIDDRDACIDLDRRDCEWIPTVTGLGEFVADNDNSNNGFGNGANTGGGFSNPTARVIAPITGQVTLNGEGPAPYTDEDDGVCVPSIPPGLKFWEGGSATNYCSLGSAQCVVVYEEDLFGGKKVVSGEECLSEQWALQANRVCSALGDCGGYPNYNGEFSDDGYEWKKNGEKQEFSPSTRNRVSGGFIGLVFAAIFGDIPLVSAQEVGVWDWFTTSIREGTDAVINWFSPTPTPTPTIGFDPSRSSSTTNFLNDNVLSEGMQIPANGWIDAGVSGLQWAAIAYFAGQLLGGVFGFDDNQTEALSTALAAGAFVGKFLYTWGETALSGTSAGLIGVAIAAVVFIVMYKDTSTEIITFECLPWQAPSGGDECEVCNDGDLPCSEYRCRSLGATCELVNKGSEQERCVNVNPNDVVPPTITPDTEVLTRGHQYADVRSSPPGPGFRIVNPEASDGCLKAYTPLTFGIRTDEQAQCRIDFESKPGFDEMVNFMGGSNLYATEHREMFSLPGAQVLQNSSLVLENGKDLTFFIRCSDKNGNANEAEYAVNFCMDDSPDNTPPRIEATSIQNNGCVAENQPSAVVDFYTNEPAECRWSTQDQSFENMLNEMSCANSFNQVNSLQLFTCTANLTGIAREGSNYFVRCRDQPSGVAENLRNSMGESYEFSLQGSTALKISSLQPNGTVFGGVSPAPVTLEVQTLFGCSEGRAMCFYSTTDNERDFIQFADTNTEDGFHTQRQDLTAGSYDYRVKCVDAGGNVARDNIRFDLEIDPNAPMIARAYQEDNQLKIVTVRDSECSYSFDSCDFTFGEGTVMPYSNTTVHVAEWNKDRTYHIKCRDEFRNEDAQCSMIVRPSDIVF